MQFTQSLVPLFDIDWTLLVGKNQVHLDAFTYMFTKVYNQPTAAISDIIPHGMIDGQIIVEVLKVHGITEEESKAKLSKAFQAINDYYVTHADKKYIEKLPGVDKLLNHLSNRNVLIGLLSGNIEKMAWNKMKMAGIKKYFSFGAFGDMAMKRVDLVVVAQKQIKEKFDLDIPIEQFVIIGDSPLDVVTAKTAGTKSIAVATGSSPVEVLSKENPTLVVKTLEDLEQIASLIFEN